MKALLIIDMQTGSFSSVPRLDADKVVARINALSSRFRNEGKPVVFIRHDGTKEAFLIPGTHDWNLLDSLVQDKTDFFVEKTANDSFYRTELDALLKKLNVDDLFITGCATDFCVNATVHSALVRDYNLTIVGDAHTTADRPGLSAARLIAFHNWLWANLTPTQGRIRVLSMEEIAGVNL